MLVQEMSEKELLSLFLPILTAHNQQAADTWQATFSSPAPLVLGPGDDAAVLAYPPGLVVTSIDTQTEGQDFLTRWPSGACTGGYEVGWKAAAQNLGDMGAMGASPLHLLVSLTLTPSTDSGWVTDFARGMTEALRAHGTPWCTVAGGDLGSGGEISVTVAATGLCQKPILRSGAQPGDVLALAGELGTAAAGLALLTSPAYTPGQNPALDRLATTQQRPLAAVTAGLKAHTATAMLDVSDGPLKDAERIAQASGVHLDLDPATCQSDLDQLLPAAHLLVAEDSRYRGQDPRELALAWCLTGGENHAMLATFDRHTPLPEGFRPLGSCKSLEEGETPSVFVAGLPPHLKGWDHFDTD